MDNILTDNRRETVAGIPYDNINWFDIQGQPFGVASRFNAIIFEDANNIIDVKGAMAIGRNFYSPRGLTLGYGNDVKLTGTGYSPDAVRFLVGGNIAMGGSLVVVGHVVAGGNFHAASTSTYLIGKDGLPTQTQELEYLYRANGGSQYWRPSDKGDHYLISSYDVPRYIPAGRIGVNTGQFFEDARNSIENYKQCIEELEVNGTVRDNFHEWVLRGNDPRQNVFLIDVRPNGLINKGIRAEVPEGSLVIVKLRTGKNAHLQYGLYGEQKRANHTLYVFEDADQIFMEVPAAIWGSFFAPQAMLHGHSTGGYISGNLALRAFAVNANSGFEFHLYPFAGGVICERPAPQQPPVPEVSPIEEAAPVPAPAPVITPAPEVPPCPPSVPCPTCPEAAPCPSPVPCPTCPEVAPCPSPVPCPTCPEVAPCPSPVPCPTCPEAAPCPPPVPCPTCPECPKCPECRETMPYVEYVPLPIPIPCPECPKPRPCPTCPELIPCPECPECPIKPGVIFGCIWGCHCCKSHDWEVKLYEICNETKNLVYCQLVEYCGCFKFEVPYEGYYLLTVCPTRYYRKTSVCKPIISLKNIGVSNFTME